VSASRPLLTAEVLSIGSELTTGETRDTNAGELAGSLTAAGVRVRRLSALPDDLAAVREAFGTAIGRADLVVSTGGLGPTPDDLTREAIAAACGETVAIDPQLETWLRRLWDRRGLPFLEINLKQAWLIPSATAIPNENGTAPGWWVDRPDGRLIVALPGPPREMRPMWTDWVVGRLQERGLGAETATVTLRLSGIGESAVADLIGEGLLRNTNPVVATYARADGVDVRISATSTGRTNARELVADAEARVREALGERVWASGTTTWAAAIDARLHELDWKLATVEHGTAGALVTLLGSVTALLDADVVGPPAEPTANTAAIGGKKRSRAATIVAEASSVRAATHADAALVVRARERRGDTAVTVAIDSIAGRYRETRLAFLGGDQGRQRAALSAADILLRFLRSVRS
jgi:nicotinamide-nucleotide amidase